MLDVTASDPGSRRDAGAWAERTGNALLHVGANNVTVWALLRKGSEKPQIQVSAQGTLPTNKTMVVFSANLDRAELGGVATYINETDKASATLFT